MYITRIESFERYKEFQHEFGSIFLENQKIEDSLSQFDGSTGKVNGISYPAGKVVDFLIDYQYSDGKSINWRERLICPITGLNNRLRASIHLSEFELGLKPYHSIYISEQLTPLYSFLQKKFPLLVGSEYLGENIEGGYINKKNIRHEDLTALSFNENEFDFVFSYETLEHIPDFKKAFAETYRVLKKGGYLFWSVPFVSGCYNNIIRATINDSGEIIHHFPPEYHGDPVQKNGILCFTHFGWAMLDDVRNIGFENAYAIIYWSKEFAYLGGEQILFCAKK